MPVDGIVKRGNRNRTSVTVKISEKVVHNEEISAVMPAEFGFVDNL